jgi:hypothetical protein
MESESEFEFEFGSKVGVESEWQMRATFKTPETPSISRCPSRLRDRRHKKPQAEIRDEAQGLHEDEAAVHRTCPHNGHSIWSPSRAKPAWVPDGAAQLCS